MRLNAGRPGSVLAAGVTLFLLSFLFLPARAADGPLLEIRFEGGYRDARAPDPFVFFRLREDGRAGCHCQDYRWVEGQVSGKEADGVRRAVDASGFFDLRGGSSRLWSWWHKWQSDAGLQIIEARGGGKKKIYRHRPLVAAEPEALRRLREAAEPLRQRLCEGASR